jgi:uncharacterized protein (TIGR03000 family)
MLRKVLSVSLVLTLAAAGLNLAAGTTQAAPHGGGGHFGGFHGGAHIGGYRSGFNYGGYRGGFHYGYRSGAHYNAYTHRYHYPHYYHRYYGAWPYYGYYGYTYPGYANDPDPGYYYGTDAGGSGDQTEQSYLQGPGNDSSAPETYSQPERAEISMTLPADATLWAQGQKIPGSGSTRQLHSPTLEPGHRYAYDFKASWKENGHTVTQKQTVHVRAGAHVKVHFPVRSAKVHARQNRAQ